MSEAIKKTSLRIDGLVFKEWFLFRKWSGSFQLIYLLLKYDM